MEVPEFARGSPLLEGAFLIAQSAHHGPRREADTDIEHPVRVAELLSAEGFDDTIVAAALLHEVIEDTATDLGEIEERSGPEVARLVATMTEDERIEPYEERKAEHRDRVARDRSAAAIYAADKLASTEFLLEHDPASAPARLTHYVRTFRELCDTYPDLPFLNELRRELELIEERGRRTAMPESMEIERKFLLEGRPGWLDEHPSVAIRQGYLAIVEGESEVRVREKDGQPVLTVKRGAGEVRREEEIDLDPDQFRALWPLTEGRRVAKRRHTVPHEELTIEVDVFDAPLAGILVAEVEFDSEEASAAFDPPEWLGTEVTGDGRYANESLATRGAPEGEAT